MPQHEPTPSSSAVALPPPDDATTPAGESAAQDAEGTDAAGDADVEADAATRPGRVARNRGRSRREAAPGGEARGVTGLLYRIIDTTRNMSPHERIRVVAGVLVVASVVAMLPFLGNITDQGFLLIALVIAALVLVLGKDKERDLKKAGLIFAFAIVGIITNKATKLLDSPIQGQPLAGPPQRRPVFGNVIDPSGARLANVSVRVRGDGMSTRTDSAGHFGLAVLESSIQNSTLEFYLVRGRQVDTVSQAVGGGDITLVFRHEVSQAAADEAGGRPAPAVAAAMHLAARPVGTSGRAAYPPDGSLAVILDSIYTVWDGGGVGGAEWSFDVKVPDGTPIHVRRTTYDDRAHRRVMAVGTETDVPVRGDTVTITVKGVRQFLALWKYQLQGSVPVAYAEVPVDRPLRREVVVNDGRQDRNGTFRFFFTILKLPGRPASE